MGVPGFFKWLWKNYKKTNFVFNKSDLDPDIDTELYNLVNNLDYLLIDELFDTSYLFQNYS